MCQDQNQRKLTSKAKERHRLRLTEMHFVWLAHLARRLHYYKKAKYNFKTNLWKGFSTIFQTNAWSQFTDRSQWRERDESTWNHFRAAISSVALSVPGHLTHSVDSRHWWQECNLPTAVGHLCWWCLLVQLIGWRSLWVLPTPVEHLENQIQHRKVPNAADTTKKKRFLRCQKNLIEIPNRITVKHTLSHTLWTMWSTVTGNTMQH